MKIKDQSVTDKRITITISNDQYEELKELVRLRKETTLIGFWSINSEARYCFLEGLEATKGEFGLK